MSTSLISGNLHRLTDAQKAALLVLLGDDDLGVYQTVRAKIIDQGQMVVEWLRPHLLHNDPVIRSRVREIVRHFERHAADNRFLGFCLSHGEDFDVEKGCWLLAQTQYPDINIEAYQALLDSWAGELLERIDFGAEPQRILLEINQHVFTTLGFAGNEQNYYDPRNSYLNCVVDRRLGNPISLCLIYLALARRLKLPVAGIGMPGHFICRFQSATDEIFIDAFHKGKLLTKADCIKYLQHTGQDFNDRSLSPISPRRILQRVCSNLYHIYENLRQEEDTARFQRYIVALSK
ncbi:MAG: transglutaminase-like domain-containing protein [Verrucomicrobiota bacterium]